MKSSMKKNVAAGVLGIILLAGVGGTFATWHAEDSLSLPSLGTGAMNIEFAEGGRWELNESSVNLEDVVLVPGDEVIGTFPIEREFSGHGLTATLNYVFVGGESGEFNLALTETNEWRVIYNEEPTSIVVSVGLPEGPITAANPLPDEITVAIKFEEKNVLDVYDMNVPINLGNLKVTLTQNTNRAS